VSVVAADGREVARGLTAYPADEAVRIAGRRSGDIAEVLGYSGGDEIIHRDDLALLDKKQQS
jgi:glutamate 5-kinase